MKKLITSIVATVFAICIGVMLSACASGPSAAKDDTYNIVYTATVGGNVCYTSSQGFWVRKSAVFFTSGDEIYAVTAEPNSGYEFDKWSDGVTTATRHDTDITADINVQAIFVKVACTVTYRAIVTDGYIDGVPRQSVAINGDAEQVTAVPNFGHVFDKWSDGVTTATRRDTAVTSDIDVTALFKKEEYSIQYMSGEHGSIVGETDQTVVYNADGAAVTAVPDKGYEFVKWSDGVLTAERQEVQVCAGLHAVAEFAPITREYELNSRTTFSSVINKPKLALTYGEVDGVKLPVPEKEHFIFTGWYYGEQKVADENGNMLVGDDFVIDEVVRNQDIRAEWTAEETFPFKILVVYVTRIQARLYDRYSIYYDIDFTMTDVQRRFCAATTALLDQTMDEMCDGLVDFQIDDYFTEQAVTTECFQQLNIRSGTEPNEIKNLSTHLYASQIPEIQGMIDQYDRVITVFGFFDEYCTSKDSTRFQYVSGVANIYGECQVNLDTFIIDAKTEYYEVTDLLNGKGKESWIKSFDVFVHELAHTIEVHINTYNYHDYINMQIDNRFTDYFETNRLYYTQSVDVDGKLEGIPYEFWKGDVANVTYKVSYDDSVASDESGRMGFISYYDERGMSPCSRQGIIYGHNALSVIAVPYIGYRFVCWSDGVDTPMRKDTDITADLTVTAIFELIDYKIKIVASEGGGIRLSNSDDLQSTITIHVRLQVRTDHVYAVAQEGYRFVGWSDGSTDRIWSEFIQITYVDWFDEDNDYTYILTAIFEKIE